MGNRYFLLPLACCGDVFHVGITFVLHRASWFCVSSFAFASVVALLPVSTTPFLLWCRLGGGLRRHHDETAHALQHMFDRDGSASPNSKRVDYFKRQTCFSQRVECFSCSFTSASDRRGGSTECSSDSTEEMTTNSATQLDHGLIPCCKHSESKS